MQHAQDKLVTDLREVVSDAEALLRECTAHASAQVDHLRGRVKSAGLEVNHRVRENPWSAVGVAAGTGLLIGLILGRK